MNDNIRFEDMTDKEKVQRRFTELMDERKNKYDPIYREIREFIHPARGEFDNETANDGKRKDKHLIDQTARRAVKTLGAGMQGGLTPPSQDWFTLTLADKELADYKPVREWLDEVKTRIYLVMARSNFYPSIHSCYEELGTFATAPMIILEDDETVIRCRSFTVGEYALAQNAGQKINTFARYIKMTAPQMIEKFGKENVSTRVQNMYERGNYKDFITVMHLIEPNVNYMSGKIDLRGMLYRSIYWEEGSEDRNKYLRISGFHEFPVPTGRWSLIGSRVYGEDGPGHNALGESKSVQVMQKDSLIALELQIKPPHLVPDNMEVNMMPGGLTPYQQGQYEGIKPLFEVQPDIKNIEYKIERIQQIIDKAFYYDLFLITSMADKQMTAREVMVRQQEKLIVLGPVIERVQSEMLKPAIDRIFGIMERRGILPPPPEEIVGQQLDVEYISIFAQSQKTLSVMNSIGAVVSFVGDVAKVYPDIVNVVNWEESVNEIALAQRAPAKIIRSDEEIAAINAAKQQQLQNAQLAQYAQMAAQGAKTLADTDTAKKSALTDMLGGMIPNG